MTNKGFGNYFQTEAVSGVIQAGKNSPQLVPHGLYAEQLSGSAFTAARHQNLHSWLYRILPSVKLSDFTLISQEQFLSSPFHSHCTPPLPMRWDPLPYPTAPTHFVGGIKTLSGNAGAAIHLYACNTSMTDTFFYNTDGELLIVPQEGALCCKTEMGVLRVKPTEILVIPRGIKFQMALVDEKARGYICENYGAPFRLPELGPIGANGLANPRDFEYPAAAYEDRNGDFLLLVKFQGQVWQTHLDHSPLDVVAWHGNYAPYKYDLTLFNTINTVSFDHPDPSIFTVLTSASSDPGIANVDFVIFPPRWMVATDTFRPPYFHRNIMSEYMGLIHGTYDAKKTGFLPGGGSLHNSFTPHGPDANTYHQATTRQLAPEYYDNTLAFMFESRHIWQVTEFAYHTDLRQKTYAECWKDLASRFELK